MWGSTIYPIGRPYPNSLASSLIHLKLWSETAVKYTAQTQTRLTGVELDREGLRQKNIST